MPIITNEPLFLPLYPDQLKIIENMGQYATQLAGAVLANSDFIADVLLSLLVDGLTLEDDEDDFDRFAVLDRLVKIIDQAKAS